MPNESHASGWVTPVICLMIIVFAFGFVSYRRRYCRRHGLEVEKYSTDEIARDDCYRGATFPPIIAFMLLPFLSDSWRKTVLDASDAAIVISGCWMMTSLSITYLNSLSAMRNQHPQSNGRATPSDTVVPVGAPMGSSGTATPPPVGPTPPQLIQEQEQYHLPDKEA